MAKHVNILKQGPTAWNKWRKENPEIRPDLRRAPLHEADLRWAGLREAYLNGAALRGADLSGADLSGANLSGAEVNWADLSGANLSGADLSWADLSGADLREAYLNGADLREAHLSGAYLSGAMVGWTTFGDVDLGMVEGLDTVKHYAPSIMGIETIYRSQGSIPEVFLRGVGLPDEFIAYIDSLVGEPIPFFSCFISYSSKDKGFCDRLYADLQSNGVRTWYFPEDAKWGETVWGEIDRSIRTYDKLVVVCSRSSLQSGPVLREIERGLRREDEEGKNILFPITIDNYIFDEWEHQRKIDVLRLVVGDFRGWKRSAAKYETALKKLLEALKAVEPKT